MKVAFDPGNITAKLEQKALLAQAKLDAQVLADSNYFCPMQTGTMQKSAIINSRIGSGTLVWRTPYAREQYYGVYRSHRHSRNPNACAKWFEAAKARYIKKWLEIAHAEYSK